MLCILNSLYIFRYQCVVRFLNHIFHYSTEQQWAIPSPSLTHYVLNLLTPNVDYSGRTAPLTSKCCILYIYSTNIGTENFKHGIYSPFFPLKMQFVS